MSEFDLKHPSYNGYPKEDVILYLDLYRLISVFGASNYLNKFRSQGEFSHYDMHSIFRKFEYSESSRLLVSIAAQLRNSIDNDVLEKTKNIAVGSIKYKKSKKELTLRDACNKILHAEYINFDLKGNPDDIFGSCLNSKIYLYGKKDKEEWRAEVLVDKFVKESFNIF
jgi:hypothetical protein